jgi:small subunit ribosomal protein S20
MIPRFAYEAYFGYYPPVMANTSSAKKANRGALKKRVFNARRKRVMKSTVKDFETFARKGAKDATGKMPEMFQAIDKAAKRGIIKKNTAARMKSRLSKLVAAK